MIGRTRRTNDLCYAAGAISSDWRDTIHINTGLKTWFREALVKPSSHNLDPEADANTIPATTHIMQLFSIALTTLVALANATASPLGLRRTSSRREAEISTRIVGGSPAAQGAYPWFVYLNDIGCGGALIHEDIVLTGTFAIAWSKSPHSLCCRSRPLPRKCWF